MGERFKSHTMTVLSNAVNRLGDNHDEVRNLSQSVLLKLMHINTPQSVWDRLMTGFSHKLWRVREETLICLQQTIEMYGAKCLSLSKLVGAIVKLLDDPNRQVSDQAMNTLVDIYCNVGERVRMDISKKGLSPQLLHTVMDKFDKARSLGRMRIDSAGSTELSSDWQFPPPYGNDEALDAK
ncbi:CLIP-associating protein 1-like [Lingula anatina]|uniref:CLIP-associating protein 1-like n=1 Tax=Lingula anatina TaxID=7574 RepID=A0A1S3I1I4_LINAN|nr:CLIP-associating protein 1-like [Lingula anatina]|eukprot:XP_013391209.1 CLIP-associating protein 1-like [Lingula anatina]